MKNDLLDPHQSIAWDADGTIASGPNARFFCNYIIAHPEKQHHIVTFRDPIWAKQVYQELLSNYGVPAHHISSVNACPQHLEAAYSIRKLFYDQSGVEAYIHWKGMTAKELGCTVLIDDMESAVLSGCQKYGITFLHAHRDFP